MKTQTHTAIPGRGPIVAILLPQDSTNEPREGVDIPYSSQQTEESAGIPGEREGVENLPPEQPDVDPLEREEPEIDEIDENEPMETPEIDQDERPVPDLDEIEPDTDREIDTEYRDDEDMDGDMIDDPIITPGTDTDLTDHPPIV